MQSSLPTSDAADEVSTLSTPGGTPARSASSARAKADSGVSFAGLITEVQPTASAGATLRVIMAIGKFQGVIAAVTPIGFLQHDDPPPVDVLRDDVAIDALGFLAEPLDEGGAVDHLAPALGQGLALLGGHQHREVFSCSR